MLTTIERNLEEARVTCEEIRRKLHRKWLASFILPEYHNYFEDKLEDLLELIDDTLGLIALSEKPLQRTEMLSRTLIEDGMRQQPIILIQTMSNQGVIAHELASIWHNDEEKMNEIEANLFDFNHLVRDMQRMRDQGSARLWMDIVGFPASNSLPQTFSLQLLKEVFDSGRQSPPGHTIIEVPSKRLARQNPPGVSAWPSNNRRARG